MAKKVIPADAEAAETGIIIKAQFAELVPFVIPDKEASLKIIAEKKAEYDLLTIAGVDDKENYDKVKKAMAEMKDTRLLLTKAAKEHVLDKAKKILDDFKTDLALITDELSAVEADLRVKKDAIDDEKERIKQHKANEKLRAIQARINDLIVLGAVFDGSIYSFEYDGGLIINTLQLDSFDDQEFEEFLEEVKTAFAEEQTRLHELKLQEEKDEADRLAEIERNKLLAAENEVKDKELTERRTKLRLKELKLLGAVQQGEDFIIPSADNYVITGIHIEVAEDGVWDELMYDMEHFTPYVEPEITKDDGLTHSTLVVDEVPAFASEFEDKPDEGQIPEMMGVQNERLFDELDIPEVDFVTEVVLSFDKDAPFIDFDISGKLLMRLYPDEYTDKAMAGIEKLANEGRIQGLCWAIISKSQVIVGGAV